MTHATAPEPTDLAVGGLRRVSPALHSPALVVLAWVAARVLMAVVYLSLSFPGKSLAWNDLGLYEFWAGQVLDTGAMPEGVTWMYPPLAVVYILLAGAFPASYALVFVVGLLAMDLAVVLLLLRARDEGGHAAGLWAWICLVPLLGLISWARLDMVPVAAAAASLLLAVRRPLLAGVLAGLGTAVKGWPVVLGLLYLRDRRWLAGAVGTGLLVALVLTLLLDDTWAFLANLGGRGIQVESVMALPWTLQQALGTPVDGDFVNGTYEVLEPGAAALAQVSKVLMVVGVGGALWLSRHRAPALRWYAAVTALLTTSPLLSTQFLLWLVGGAAVAAALPGPDGHVARRSLPVVALVVALTHLTFPLQWGGLVNDGVLAATSLLLRNGLLIALLGWLLVSVRGRAEGGTAVSDTQHDDQVDERAAHQRVTDSPASSDSSR